MRVMSVALIWIAGCGRIGFGASADLPSESDGVVPARICDFETDECGLAARPVDFSCFVDFGCGTYQCPDASCACAGSTACVHAFISAATSARSHAGLRSLEMSVSLPAGTLEHYATQRLATTSMTFEVGDPTDRYVTFWLATAPVGGVDRHSHRIDLRVCNATGTCTAPVNLGRCHCDISTLTCPSYPDCREIDLLQGFAATEIGVDGTSWFRFTQPLPIDLGGSLYFEWNTEVYKWGFTDTTASKRTMYWLDDLCMSDVNGTCSP